MESTGTREELYALESINWKNDIQYHSDNPIGPIMRKARGEEEEQEEDIIFPCQFY